MKNSKLVLGLFIVLTTFAFADENPKIEHGYGGEYKTEFVETIIGNKTAIAFLYDFPTSPADFQRSGRFPARFWSKLGEIFGGAFGGREFPSTTLAEVEVPANIQALFINGVEVVLVFDSVERSVLSGNSYYKIKKNDEVVLYLRDDSGFKTAKLYADKFDD
jgi:hypothetical protein